MQRRALGNGVSLALSCLADPQVLYAVAPPPGESFDPPTFLSENGTLCPVGDRCPGASWSLVAPFIEVLVATDRHLAAACQAPGWTRRYS